MAARGRIGAFGSPEDLLDVPGIGPATLQRIRPLLDLSQGAGIPRQAGSRLAPQRLAGPPAAQGSAPIDINHASAAELAGLPGVGPTLARRIVEARADSGGFQRAEELLEVRGIGPATLARLLPLIRVGGR